MRNLAILSVLVAFSSAQSAEILLGPVRFTTNVNAGGFIISNMGPDFAAANGLNLGVTNGQFGVYAHSNWGGSMTFGSANPYGSYNKLFLYRPAPSIYDVSDLFIGSPGDGYSIAMGYCNIRNYNGPLQLSTWGTLQPIVFQPALDQALGNAGEFTADGSFHAYKHATVSSNLTVGQNLTVSNNVIMAGGGSVQTDGAGEVNLNNIGGFYFNNGAGVFQNTPRDFCLSFQSGYPYVAGLQLLEGGNVFMPSNLVVGGSVTVSNAFLAGHSVRVGRADTGCYTSTVINADGSVAFRSVARTTSLIVTNSTDALYPAGTVWGSPTYDEGMGYWVWTGGGNIVLGNGAGGITPFEIGGLTIDGYYGGTEPWSFATAGGTFVATWMHITNSITFTNSITTIGSRTFRFLGQEQ